MQVEVVVFRATSLKKLITVVGQRPTGGLTMSRELRKTGGCKWRVVIRCGIPFADDDDDVESYYYCCCYNPHVDPWGEL